MTRDVFASPDATLPNDPPREVAWDCRHFLGDRPCVFHKQTGVVCTCANYDQIVERLLIIKLDAMGDVLRSTALLPSLVAKHPGAAITWLTRRESVPLLHKNPYVKDLLELGAEALSQLHTRTFDRVINLDASPTSASLATMARATRKDGFVLDAQGIVRPTNDAARTWLETGVFDDLKRRGTSTYQDRMTAILGLTGLPHRYVFELTTEERARGRAHLQSLGLNLERPIVGLNTGAGGRWPLKQWTERGYVELVDRVGSQQDVQFLLLGGPGERDRNERLKAASLVKLHDAGCDNAVRHFAACVAHCDVVVTGDTLAMHLALALRRRTIVLFGPTSAPEIELYGLGEKILPDMTCLSCYKTSCDFSPNCMDLIPAEAVAAALFRQLNLALAARATTAAATDVHGAESLASKTA